MAKLTKERIVSTGRSTVAEIGHERLALRQLARDLGVTAPALYDHFDSRDSLLRAIAADGFVALTAAVAVDGERAIDRLRERALAYVRFATDNPELFRLMFMFRPAAIELVDHAGAEVDNELDAASDAFEEGLADLESAIADGDIVDRDPTELALLLWTSTHGMATVALTAPGVVEGVAREIVDTMLNGLRPKT